MLNGWNDFSLGALISTRGDEEDDTRALTVCSSDEGASLTASCFIGVLYASSPLVLLLAGGKSKSMVAGEG